MATKKKKQARKKRHPIFAIYAILAIFGIVWIVLMSLGRPSPAMAPATPTPYPNVTVSYKCSGGAKITADYLNSLNKVRVTLPGGQQMTVPHAMSADGARYANSDESFVFWSRGNTAFIEQNGNTTYQNCIQQ